MTYRNTYIQIDRHTGRQTDRHSDIRINRFVEDLQCWTFLHVQESFLEKLCLFSCKWPGFAALLSQSFPLLNLLNHKATWEYFLLEYKSFLGYVKQVFRRKIGQLCQKLYSKERPSSAYMHWFVCLTTK